MSAHTPGPWHWDVDPLENRTPDVLVDKDSRAVMVANWKGSEADARLIAHAPELLAALEAVVAFSGAHGGPYAEARAAIAKATGGAA
jgi:hypothetical protein